VSGLGLAMIARYVPASMGGFMMGAYFVASGVSQYLGGVVASYASISGDITNDPVASLPIYTSLFNKLGIAALVCTMIAVAVLPLMKRLSNTHRDNSNAIDPNLAIAD
jgi:POT family proton-dependent oligopeptide transporter